MKAVVSWSGGKDCLLALQAVLKSPSVEVVALVTTIGAAFDRVSMHGVRRTLLLKQCASLGIPCHVIAIPACRDETPTVASTTNNGYVDFPSNDTYVPAVTAAFSQLRETHGIEVVVHGDIFLEDLRAWRDRLLEGVGLKGIYPLWKQDTSRLLRDFVQQGHRAKIVCVNHEQLSPSWAGRELSDVLHDPEYPPHCDPCGENGEFHSFVYDSPLFSPPVPFRRGEIVTRGMFTFQDLIDE